MADHADGEQQESIQSYPAPHAAVRWLLQLKALVLKNLAVRRRQPCSLLILALLPTLALIATSELAQSVVPSTRQRSTSLQKCVLADSFRRPTGERCTTLAYAPHTAETEAVMDIAAQRLGLTDVNDTLPFASSRDMLVRLAQAPGSLYHLVTFDNSSFVNGSASVSYIINSNSTISSAAEQSSELQGVLVQQAVDSAVLQWWSGDDAAGVRLAVDWLPAFESDDLSAGSSFVALVAPLFLVMATALTGVMQMQWMRREKADGLLGSLRMLGLYDTAHWLSWMLIFMLEALVAALLAAAVARALPLRFARSCDYGSLLITLLMGQWSYSALMLTVAANVSNARWAGALSLLLFMTAMTSTMVVGILGGSTYTAVYSPAESTNAKFWAFINPSFHFGRVLDAIIKQTSPAEGPGVPFVPSNMTAARANVTVALVTGGKVTFSPPTLSTSLANMFLLMLLYFALAWYCGHVRGGKDFASRRPWFFLQASFWGFITPPATDTKGDSLAREAASSAADRSIRLWKLSKSYDSATAVKELTLDMSNGEVFCLLGQNGAGKTTTIKMLSGLTEPSHGHAWINGLHVATQMASIQRTMGVCPQHDLLWPQLTGLQHLQLFARFRYVPAAQLDAHCNDLLRRVFLHSDGVNPAITYSGGMKRRLSLCMAFAGAPRVCFLDEPTTGMDPLTRRRVWEAVRALRGGRIIVLTTHSMEEADLLGDKIAILATGKLRAIGSSLFLKSHFGTGYQVSLLGDADSSHELSDRVRQLLPGAELLSSSAGALTVGIPRNAVRHLPAFFRELQGELAELCREWGISNTTLEDVFLRLVADEKEVSEIAVASKSKMCQLCGKRPAEDVSLYTKSGVAVHVEDVVCSRCALAESSEDGKSDDDDSAAKYALTADDADDDMEEHLLRLFPADSSSAPMPAEGDGKAAAGDGKAAAGDGTFDDGDDAAAAAAAAEAAARDKAELRPALKPVSNASQIAAVVRKNMLLQSKSRRTLACQCCVIIVITLLALLLQPLPRSVYTICPGGYLNFTLSGNVDACDAEQLADMWLQSPFEHNLAPYSDPAATELCDPASGACLQTLVGPGLASTSPPSNGYTAVRLWLAGERAGDVQALPWYGGLSPAQLAAVDSVQPYDIKPIVQMHDAGNDVTAVLDGIYQAQVDNAEAGVDVSELCAADFGYELLEDTWEEASTTRRYYESADEGIAAFAAAFPDALLHVSGGSDDDSSPLQVEGTLYGWFGSYNPSTTVVMQRNSTADAAFAAYESDYLNGTTRTSGGDYYNSRSLLPLYGTCWQATTRGLADVQVAAVSSSLTNTLARTINSSYSINSAKAGLPFLTYPFSNFAQQVNFVLVILFPTAATLLASSYARQMSKEHSDQLWHHMHIMGLRPRNLWAAYYLTGLLMNCALATLFVVVGQSIGVRAMTPQSGGVWAAVIFVFAHAGSCLSLFIGAMFKSPRAALSLDVIILICAAASVAINLSSWTWPLALFPPMGLAWVTAELFNTMPAAIPPTSPMATALAVTTLSSSLLAALAVARWYASQAGGNSPLNKLKATLWQAKEAARARQRAGTVSDSRPVDVEMADVDISFGEDEDVRMERSRLLADGHVDDAAETVVLRQLSKQFSTATGVKRVVRSVTLAVRHGECFGLLGPNGAGKTTIFNMLTGLFQPTSGDATVAGYSASFEGAFVQRLLGVCPQFDRYWPSLSVGEHLAYYARLKGLPKPALVARQVAEAVELDGDSFDTAASELSGGQRRRLSLGAALLGKPRVVILDEPTTGLDPSARQQVWRIVQRMKASYSVMLTTHSMEEADALCDRIGIVARGSLRCLGSQLRLKNRYGQGYKLALSMCKGLEESDVTDWITTAVSPGAKLVHSLGASRTYMLPKATADVARVFQQMELHRSEQGIQEWELRQTSLEEVFISIARASEEEDN